jgi:hypothetical protein
MERFQNTAGQNATPQAESRPFFDLFVIRNDRLGRTREQVKASGCLGSGLHESSEVPRMMPRNKQERKIRRGAIQLRGYIAARVAERHF